MSRRQATGTRDVFCLAFPEPIQYHGLTEYLPQARFEPETAELTYHRSVIEMEIFIPCLRRRRAEE